MSLIVHQFTQNLSWLFRLQETISCTDELSKWLVPRMKTEEMAAAVGDICWDPTPGESVDPTVLANSKGSFNTVDSLQLVVPYETPENRAAEIKNFLDKLQTNGVSCPIMAYLRHCQNFYTRPI